MEVTTRVEPLRASPAANTGVVPAVLALCELADSITGSGRPWAAISAPKAAKTLFSGPVKPQAMRTSCAGTSRSEPSTRSGLPALQSRSTTLRPRTAPSASNSTSIVSMPHSRISPPMRSMASAWP